MVIVVENRKPYLTDSLNSTKVDPIQQEKNPEALKEGLALLQNAQNLIGQQCAQRAFVQTCWDQLWNNPFDLMVEKIMVPHHLWPLHMSIENHHFHWSRLLSPNLVA